MSVLVVGGGIAGLSTALFLSWHGTPCTLVERHPDLLIHPRARGLTPRTMELYRQVGLEEAIHAEAYGGSDFAWTPVKADTLNDAEYTAPDEPQEDDGSGASPCGFGPIDQDKLEGLVRDKARELGADLRFSTELRSFTQDGDGVTATLGAGDVTVRADYLVAADGFHSPVRHALGIEVDGPGQMVTVLTAIVEADLNPAVRGRAATIAYLEKPRPFTIMMAHDDTGHRWVFGTGIDPAREPLESFTDDRVAELVRAAAGLPDVAVTPVPQIPGTDIKVLAFPIGAHVARAYRSGRVFLVGDAAHVWPPTGGLGANTGIQDAHNLAWKLAAVLGGDAGPDLLATYDAERRATGLLTMGQAMARFGTRVGAAGEGPEIIDYGAVAAGYQYRSSAIVDAPDDDRPVLPSRLAGRPGTRAPHVDLDAGQSTLDLYGTGFVLLTGDSGWVTPAEKLGIRTHRLGAHVLAAHGVHPEGAVLVRPDGFVAWHSHGAAADADGSELTAAYRQIMSR